MLSPKQLNGVFFERRSHTSFPEMLLPESIQLIVYNLGYLPGGDKGKTTFADDTLASLKAALLLIAPGGAINITCYPGHPEGALEQEKILAFAKMLSPSTWSCCLHQFVNRSSSPSLLLMQKAIGKTHNSAIA
jgi:hypothetical protein